VIEPNLPEFEFACRTRIVFGPGSIRRLGDLVKEYGGGRVLLVTDPGIVRAGHAARAESSLRAAGLTVSVFDRVVENPTTKTVEQCVLRARRAEADFLVGLGGGSSIDAARGSIFLLAGGGRMEDYWGVGKAVGALLPLIAIPTTAGTGSECQSFALISQEKSHVKMACGDPKAAAKVAILDPELTLTQPAPVTAATGIDALSHAIESAVTKRRSPLSEMLSHKAFRLCVAGLEGFFADPRDLRARGTALLGAALAGMAVENSMLGAAHAAANPLTVHYGVTHGQAVGMMLPAVVRYNSEVSEVRTIYQRLALGHGSPLHSRDPAGAAEVLAKYLEGCLERAGLPRSLAGLHVEEPDFDELAHQAAGQWTGKFNPRSVGPEDFARLYRSVAAD
jgi:alcohol dehydrogenase